MNIEYRFVDHKGLEHVHTSPRLTVVVHEHANAFGDRPLDKSGQSVVQLSPTGWRMKGEPDWRPIPEGAL